jgi:CHAD domain-containing protein
MLKKKRQHEYIDKRCKSMILHINAFCVKKSPEELHKLRVEIKKLRAFISFAEKLTNEKFSKHIKPVIKIFKQAGEMRTANLNLKMIRKYRIHNAGFKKEQQAVFKTASEEFCASSEKNKTSICECCEAIRGKCHDIDNKEIIDFYKKRIRSLSAFFSKKTGEGKLHDHRKKIKILLYTESFLQRSVREKLKLNRSYLDALQNAIGEWHDTTLLIGLFQNMNFAGKETIKQLTKKRETLLQAATLQAKEFDKNVITEKEN